MGYLLQADDPLAQDEQVSGGKGSSLARLTALGFPVPPFFVVSVGAFRDMAAAGALSDEFREELRSGYERLGGDGARLAVRSSAIGEDSSGSSFAGLYHTSLDVRGFDALLAALQECWRSYDSAQVAAYRERQAAAGPGGMAVVVQEFIAGDWSGVTFTANPVSQLLGEVVINVVPGIGESLVAGEVNPEEVVVRRADGVMVRRRSGQGATCPQPVLKEVWRQGVSVADRLAFPQDVEWTWKDGRLYLLQARPITTLGALFYNRCIEPWKDTPEHAEDPARIWSRAYSDEIWTSPTSPLFYNIQNLSGSFTSYWKWHHDESPLPPAVFKYYKAAAYVDVEVLQRMYEYHPRFSRIAGIINFFPKEQQERVRKAPFRWQGRLRRTYHFEREERKLRSLAWNYRYLEQQWPDFVKLTDEWFDRDLSSATLDELRAHQGEVFGAMASAGPPCGFGVAYHAHDLTFVLTGLLDRWFGDGDALYADVTSGLDNSETVAETQAIWELARLARQSPEVAGRVEGSSWAELASAEPGDLKPFVDAFSAFLRSHRHRGASYKDLTYPRWGDDPELLLTLVKGYMNSDAPSPAEQNRLQGVARRKRQEELLRRAGGPAGPARRALLRWLFRYNEIYMDVRDNHRYYFDRVWYELRRVYLGYGRVLMERGVLAEAGDVFFLGAGEVEEALKGDLEAEEARKRVASRGAEWHETLHTQAPKFLKGYLPFDDGEVAPAGSSQLTGVPASPGVKTGPARVVYTLAELGRVEDGDILITRQTDPGWTPVFARIGGLVLETGGVLAHGTSLCREYGLPCVTALEKATARIADGATVRIDGARGTVEVISAGSP
jgi:pyruvate,water dikinase